MKIAVIFHRLGPYHFARLCAAGAAVQVVAIETSGADETYAWDRIAGVQGFERVTLFSDVDAQKQPGREVARRMVEALAKIRPSVVVAPGWGDAAALAAVQWCQQQQTPAVVMSESTAWDEPRKSWKEFVKRKIVGLFSAGLAGGTPHRDYLEMLGLARDRVFLGYDAVDNRYFADKAAEVRNQKSAVTTRHGLPENYFLASNRFIEKKNLPRLIGAYASYRGKAGKLMPETLDSGLGTRDSGLWKLVLLGDGALRPALYSQIQALGLQEHVQIPGFKQYPELPEYYARAKVFIHASTTEQWGLVVNEAMASGLPVLVSNRCGCAQDLVRDGANGFTFDPQDVEQLTGLMLKMSAPHFPLADFGMESQRIIADWGPERFAGGLKLAVAKALEVGPVKPTLAQKLILRALLAR